MTRATAGFVQKNLVECLFFTGLCMNDLDFIQKQMYFATRELKGHQQQTSQWMGSQTSCLITSQGKELLYRITDNTSLHKKHTLSTKPRLCVVVMGGWSGAVMIDMYMNTMIGM